MNIKNIIFVLFIIANIKCLGSENDFLFKVKDGFKSSLTFVEKLLLNSKPQKNDTAKYAGALGLGSLVSFIAYKCYKKEFLPKNKDKFFGLTVSTGDECKFKINQICGNHVKCIKISLNALLAIVLSYFTFRNFDKLDNHKGLDKIMFGTGLFTGSLFGLNSLLNKFSK